MTDDRERAIKRIARRLDKWLRSPAGRRSLRRTARQIEVATRELCQPVTAEEMSREVTI